MLISDQGKAGLYNGIFGQTVTPTPTVTATPTPTVSPGVAYVTPVSTTQMSPLIYAQHSIEYALKYHEVILSRMGYARPWYKRVPVVYLPDQLYKQIIDYAHKWSRITSYPKVYTSVKDGKQYGVYTSDWIYRITPVFLKRVMEEYYQYFPISEKGTPATPYISPTPTTPTPTVTPARRLPLDMAAIVKKLFDFWDIPIQPGTLKPTLYDRVIESLASDMRLYDTLPQGMTWAAVRNEAKGLAAQYLTSIGITKGRADQYVDFLPTGGGVAPLPYEAQRAWWSTTDEGRAKWAVKVALLELGITYNRRGTYVDLRMLPQIVTGAKAWLVRVKNDTAIVRDAGDRRDMDIAIRLVTTGLLDRMKIHGQIPYVTPPPVTPTYVTPTPVTTPYITPTPVTTPYITPTPVTPTPTPTARIGATYAAKLAFNEIWKRYRSLARAISVAGGAWYILDESYWPQMLTDGAALAKQIYEREGGDPRSISDEQWEALINSAARVSNVTTRDTAPAVVRAALWEQIRTVTIKPVGPSPTLVTPTPTPTFTPVVPTPVPTPVPTLTPVISREEALKLWATTAPIFDTYEQCRAAAEAEVGRTPDRYRHCLTEADMVTLAVTHALRSQGIRPYPGSLEMPESAFDRLTAAARAIAEQMVYQRTYTPVVGGEVLELTR